MFQKDGKKLAVVEVERLKTFSRDHNCNPSSNLNSKKKDY